MTTSEYLAELGLAVDASRADISAALERRMRQAAALANTAPERSQAMRDRTRAMKRALLPDEGDTSAANTDPASGGPTSQVRDAYLAPDPDTRTSLGVAADPPGGDEPNLGVAPAPVEPELAGLPSNTPSMTPPPGEPAGPSTGMRRFAGSRRRLIVAAAAATAVLVAGIGIAVAASSGSDEPRAAKSSRPVSVPVARTSDPTDASTTAESPTATVSSPAAPVDYAPGDTVLDSDGMTAACGDEQAAFPDSTDDPSTISGESWTGSLRYMTASGVAILDCSGTGGDRVVAVDTTTNTVLWNRMLASEATQGDESGTTTVVIDGGAKNIYRVATTDHPAEGLRDEYWTRTLTAADTRTGVDRWTIPLEPGNRESSDATTATVDEQHSTTPGQTVDVVNLQSYTGVDADTGKVLWTRKELPSVLDYANSSDVVDYGRVIEVGDDGEGNTVVVALDLSSGKQLWRLRAKSDAVLDTGTTFMDGVNWWFVGSSSEYEAFDVLRGVETAHGKAPESWEHTLIGPRQTVALVGDQLQMYRTGEWSKPVWSQKSDDTTPDVITSSAVLVSAAAGGQLLDAHDGSILQSDVADVSGSQDQVVGSVLATQDLIVEVGKV